MLADPQSIKINGVTTSLPRTQTGEGKAKYESADGLLALSLSTQRTGKGRKRHTMRVDNTKVVASTLLPSQNEEASTSIYVVVDRPLTGFSNEELKKIYEGFAEILSATSFEKFTKLVGGES
jgi:type I site-specific restriction-modification system R (restriction) subunit